MEISNITIRNAKSNDIINICKLFEISIKNTCITEYTKEQISAWVETGKYNTNWKLKIEKDFFIIAEIGSLIVGFGSLENNGHIDLLYVHSDFQKIGIATKILSTIENEAINKNINRLWTDSSITAIPFFINNNYIIENTYEKSIQNCVFLNTILSKKIL